MGQKLPELRTSSCTGEPHFQKIEGRFLSLRQILSMLPKTIRCLLGPDWLAADMQIE